MTRNSVCIVEDLFTENTAERQAATSPQPPASLQYERYGLGVTAVAVMRPIVSHRWGVGLNFQRVLICYRRSDF